MFARATVLLLALAVPRLALGYGEPDGAGRPNHRERLLHLFTNQVRQAPHDWPGWDTTKGTADPRRPVLLHNKLVEAARFHADDMSAHACFQHESCDGTPFETRVARYYSGAGAGENIYTSFGDDSERSAITGWMNSDGHRRNILDGNWTDLGTGEATKSGGQIFYVQDFGLEVGADIPPIPGAARELAGAEVKLYATVHDAQGRAPSQALAILDGASVPLAKIAGGGGSLTYGATVPAPDHCAPLYFEVTPATGPATTFPTTGSLLIGEACTAEFTTERAGVVDPNKPGPVIIDAAEERGCTSVRVGRAGAGNDGSPGRGDPGATALWAMFGIVWLIRRRR